MDLCIIYLVISHLFKCAIFQYQVLTEIFYSSDIVSLFCCYGISLVRTKEIIALEHNFGESQYFKYYQEFTWEKCAQKY